MFHCRYLLDDEGNMTEYLPETSICAVQLDSQANMGNEDSSDTSNSEAIPAKLEEPAELGILLMIVKPQTNCSFYRNHGFS